MFKAEKIQAFTAEQVCSLTGLSKHQLSYWDETDFFNPRFVDDREHVPYRKIYSFRDVVGLRTISYLRNEKGISLQELRKVGDYLKENFEQPWTNLRFIVGPRRKVYFQEPGKDIAFQAHRYGQGDYLVVQLEDMARQIDEKITTFRRQHGEIGKNRYIVRNDPVIKGTRIRSRAIWNYHEQGYSLKQILSEYPSLSREDVEAAIEYEKKNNRNRAA